MRNLVARFLAVALGGLLIIGCSSNGGKSFSASSLNPMSYFTSSNSPVAKPSKQMAPTVSIPSAEMVSNTGGLAPPSPYGATATGFDQPQGDWSRQYAGSSTPSRQLNSSANDSSSFAPQVGMYNPNGYDASNSVPSPYNNPTLGTAGNSGSGYGLAGSRYDTQGPATPAGSLAGTSAMSWPATPPAGAASAPHDPSAGGGYYGQSVPDSTYPNPGLAQGGYPNPYAADVNPAYGSPWPTTSGTSAADPTNRRDMGGIASLPAGTSAGYNASGQWAYQPGNTGYNPPNVPPYTPPIGYLPPYSNSEAVQAASAQYAPGSTSRYESSSIPTTTAPLPYASGPTAPYSPPSGMY